MLKIGDFSKLSRITIRMLRHYDEIGLLKPTTIDEWTGYRYYDEMQLLTANKIQLLKNLGFGLSAIKEVLMHFDDYIAIEKLLKIKQTELVAQQIELREQIKHIDRTINNLKQAGDFMNYDVNLKTIPELYVASVRKIIANYMSEGELWSLLMPEIEKQKCKAITPFYAMAVYHDNGFVDSNADVEVCLAIAGKYNDTSEVKFKTIPTVNVASCIFKGSYEQIASVNAAIAKWVNKNGFAFNGVGFRIYHKSPYETKNSKDYITEVCFPVEEK